MAETSASATTTPPAAGCCCRPDAVSFLPRTRFCRLVAAIPKFTLRRPVLLTAVRKRWHCGTQPPTPPSTQDEAEAPEKPARSEAEQPPLEEHAADADPDTAASAGTQPPTPPPTSEEADAPGKPTQPPLEEHAADADPAAASAARNHRRDDCSLYEVGELKGADGPCSATATLEETMKERKRRKKAKREKRTSDADAPEAAIAGKYWAQRHSLFSLYDRGVHMDAEGWYSATPEAIAAAQAARAGPADLVVDAFAGNSIQFAASGCYVLAVDIDPCKVELARHNARIYGVEDMVEFVVGDFFRLAPALKADLVFLSPPWGGPSYNKTPIYTLDVLKPKDGYTLFQAAQRIAPNIIMFLPRNVDIRQVKDLSWLCSPPLHFKSEENYVQGRSKGIKHILETWQEVDIKKRALLCGNHSCTEHRPFICGDPTLDAKSMLCD